MKHTKIRYYFIFISFILIIVHFYMKIYIQYLQEWPYPHLGVMNTISLFTFKHLGALLFEIFLGMFFGIEKFLKNIYKNGKWHIDIKRLIIIGVPALLLSIEAVHFFLLDNILAKIGLPFIYLVAPAREPFFRFLVGYTILTSFYKE